MNNSICTKLIILVLFLNPFYLLAYQIEKKSDTYYEKAVQFESKNLDSAFLYIEKSYKVQKKIDTLNTHFSDVLNQYGRLYYYKQNFKKAYFYFSRCFNNSLILRDKKGAYKVKVNMATCQDKLGNSKEALKEFLELIDYYEKNDEMSLTLGISYFNVAGLYQKEDNFKMAESFYLKCIPFFKEKEKFFIQLQGNRIGNFNNFNLEEAKKIIIELRRDVKFDELPRFLRSLLYNNMARTMKLSKNYKDALLFTFKALKLKKKSKIEHDIAIQYQNIGEIYTGLNKDTLAIIYLDSAITFATSNRQKLQIFKNLQEAHKGVGNTIKSLEFANSYIQLKDSLTEVLTKKEIAELGIKYQTKKNKNLIFKLKQLSLVYKILLLLSILLGFYLVFRLLKKNKNVKKEFEVLQKEISLLNSKKDELSKESKNLKLKSNVILNVNDILYIKSDGHYVEYYMNEKERPIIDRTSLLEAAKELPSNSFVKMHRSYIVNIYKIKIINSTKLMLENGVWLNISRIFKEQLKDVLEKEINY